MNPMTNASHELLRERDREMIPAPLLRMMLALVVASLLLTAYAVVTGREPTGQPKPSPVTAERQLVIKTGGAKAVTLYDADGTFLTHLDHGGFVTVIGNGLDRARTVARVGQDVPVTLARHENGRLTVTDPATGWRVELTAFGSDNEAAFAALLPGA
jgi:putative photosynthetic complex assembly protein